MFGGIIFRASAALASKVTLTSLGHGNLPGFSKLWLEEMTTDIMLLQYCYVLFIISIID